MTEHKLGVIGNGDVSCHDAKHHSQTNHPIDCTHELAAKPQTNYYRCYLWFGFFTPDWLFG